MLNNCNIKIYCYITIYLNLIFNIIFNNNNWRWVSSPIHNRIHNVFQFVEYTVFRFVVTYNVYINFKYTIVN